MKKTLIFLYFSIFLIANAFAQNPNFTAEVIDGETNEALIGANIKIENLGGVTDENGRFSTFLKDGKYEVIASYIGYTAEKQQITIENLNEIKITFRLQPTNVLLNTATVTAGKFEKPLSEVTVSLDVLKPKLIENVNTQSIESALDKIPGVNMVGGQANIRGGSGFSYGAGSRVLLLIDDIPALQADAGYPNWNDIAVENIEQVEIVKGAASALYGSSAMNGIINIRTAYAKDKPITQAATYYTTFNAPKDPSQKWWTKTPYATGLSAAHRQKMGKLDLVLSTNLYKIESYNKDTREQYGRITAGIRYRIKDNLAIGFNSNFNFGESESFFYWLNGTNGVYQGTPSTFQKANRNRFIIDPFLTYFDAKGNRHKILSRIYSVDNQNNNGTQNNSNQSKLYYGEYQFQKEFESNLVLTSGLVGIKTNVKAALYGNNEYSTSNAAAYAQMDKKFFGKLNTSVGFRYEYNQINSPTIIGKDTIPNGKSSEAKPVFRLGLNYAVAKATFLRASWGQGYRFPTIAEKFITSTVGGLPISPNVNLTSETGWTTELGAKQGIKINKWMGFFDVAAFWSEYQDVMEFTLIRTFPLRFKSLNIGNTIIKGVEFSVMGTGKIGNINTSLLTGYTFIDPKFKDFDEESKISSSADYNILKYRSKHNIKFDWESTYNKFSIGTAINHTSNMEAIDRVFNELIPGLKAFRIANNKGFTVADIRLAYQATDKIKLSFLVKNLANAVYYLRPALLEAPRNFTVRLEGKF